MQRVAGCTGWTGRRGRGLGLNHPGEARASPKLLLGRAGPRRCRGAQGCQKG